MISIQNMSSMLANNIALKTLDMSNWILKDVINMSSFCAGCSSLEKVLAPKVNEYIYFSNENSYTFG
jgi:surface protein